MSDVPRRRHRPCRERIDAFRNPTICSSFDCSACPRVLPPPDGGCATEWWREKKSYSFCQKIFGFSGFPNLAWWPRSPAKTFGNLPYLSLSGSAAAPPSGGAKTWPCCETRRGRCVLRVPAAGPGMAAAPTRCGAFFAMHADVHVHLFYKSQLLCAPSELAPGGDNLKKTQRDRPPLSRCV